ILHGMKDEVVPWAHGVRLMETLTARDVRMELIKDGDHRLSRPQDLQRLGEMAAELHNLALREN
ncbi:MAG TPA: alpha/beta hydrolase, partial [Asticcacaulis sp.]